MTMRTMAVLCVVLVGSGVTAFAQTPTPARPQTTPPAPTTPVAPVEDAEMTALRAKATAGDATSQSEMGFYYEIRQDYAQAVSWFRKAAHQGHPKAQNQLGLAYALGLGVTQDYAQAVAWYRKSAEQGDVKAQNNLGVLYDTGRGVPQDYAQAVSWYRKAADQGDAFAQNNLGMLYAKGHGVPQDYVSAYFWHTVAGARGTYDTQKEAAKNRDDIAAKMTPQQVADAQELAREWLAAFQKRGGK